MTAPLLEVRNLRHAYGSHVALSGVSLTVHEGEIFGLLGPNGAGKTTLLTLVSGLFPPSSGAVMLQGETLTPTNAGMKRKIGVAPQELAIYPELTSRENLRFFGEIYGLRGAELDARIEELLRFMGLEDPVGRQLARTLSGGQQRRLNLGLAILHRPRLLLLDEPTAGVDPQTRNHLFEGIRRINAEGTTIVYTSHYMEEVQTLCRRVGIIDHGKLIACDEVSKLLTLLPSVIRIRIDGPAEETQRAAVAIEGVVGCKMEQERMKIECHSVPPTLSRWMAICQERHWTILSLETTEPNLERVFLHLTGRALRD
ncbi:MAG: ABC transporter ATP-binding protein [Gemmataceae bacterium]|nr:ABC transporter ATP-binding protein [Gemmataceae bacterium]